jgi:hypothetical protein
MRTLLMISISLMLAWSSNYVFSQTNVLPNFQKAETRSQQKPSIAIMAGLSDPQSRSPSAANFGAEFAYQPYIPITAAAEINSSTFPSQGNSPTLTRTRLFAKAAYNFGGSTAVIKDSYVGFGLGPVFDNIQNRMDVEFGFAPMIGFDIPLTRESERHVSLGANASYLFVGGAKADVFALDGVAKYWF